MDFDKILFMHWYIWLMLWLIHIIFPNFSTELWLLIDFRIMFVLNILWNNWWIWSNLVVTLIFFYAKTCATTKISTVAGYHVLLATLLFLLLYWTILVPDYPILFGILPINIFLLGKREMVNMLSALPCEYLYIFSSSYRSSQCICTSCFRYFRKTGSPSYNFSIVNIFFQKWNPPDFKFLSR